MHNYVNTSAYQHGLFPIGLGKRRIIVSEKSAVTNNCLKFMCYLPFQQEGLLLNTLLLLLVFVYGIRKKNKTQSRDSLSSNPGAVGNNIFIASAFARQ